MTLVATKTSESEPRVAAQVGGYGLSGDFRSCGRDRARRLWKRMLIDSAFLSQAEFVLESCFVADMYLSVWLPGSTGNISTDFGHRSSRNAGQFCSEAKWSQD